MNAELIRVGSMCDHLYDDYFDDGVEEEQGQICRFSMNSYDLALYSIIEYECGDFKFVLEHEGGYEGTKREFSDVELLKHYCMKMVDMLEIEFKATAIHNHLFDEKAINREVSLKKLL